MDKNNMLLSIIMPIYNMDQYLPECLASLDKQGFGDEVEILLVDDGSTDGSLEICENAAVNNACYKVLHQKNAGVAAARNTGLAHAVGKYVAWVDPDDYITDDWWNTVKETLSSNPDMIYFDMYILKNEKLQEKKFDKCSRIISKQELCEELAIGNRIQSHLCSKIIRRRFFDQPFSNMHSYCEDFAVLHHVCWHVNECKYINKPLYVYRQVENSITNDENKLLDNALLGIRLYKKRYRFYKQNGVKVSEVGIYLAMLWYCNNYALTKNVHNKKIYRLCLALMRKNISILLTARRITIVDKIKICCNLILGSHLYEKIKSQIWRLLKH